MRLRILYLLSLAVLSACGNKNGSFYTAPTGTLDSTNASTAKSQLATSAVVSFTKPGDVTAPSRATFPSSCYTADPTTKVDADGDGIALKSVYTFNCSNTAGSGNSYTMKGSFTEADKDDTAGSNHAGGWRYDLDYTMTLASARASTNGNYTLQGFFELTKGTANYTYASNYQMAFSGATSPTRATYDITFGSTWNHTITPDDMTQPKKTGSITFSGFWGYKYNVSTRASASGELVLQGSSEGLKYDQACTYFYKEGTITFKAGTGSMTMTYGCDTATVVKLNGTTI